MDLELEKTEDGTGFAIDQRVVTICNGGAGVECSRYHRIRSVPGGAKPSARSIGGHLAPMITAVIRQ